MPSYKNKRKNKNNLFVGRGNYEYVESVFDKHEGFILWFEKLYGLALASIGVNNLPLEIFPLDIIRQIIDSGSSCFFYDDISNKYICLPYVSNGKYDVYGRPTEYRAIGHGGVQFPNLNNKNSVIIWGSVDGRPLLHTIFKYAERLAEIELTMLLNVDKQKHPYFISCPENQRLSFVNLMKSVIGNERIIYGNTDIDLNNIQVIRTDAPFVADKLYDLLLKEYHEYITFLGISNVSIEKAERMNTDEVNRQMGGVMVNRQKRLYPLQLCAEKINNMFGLDIEFTFNETDAVEDDSEQYEEREEDNDNE